MRVQEAPSLRRLGGPIPLDHEACRVRAPAPGAFLLRVSPRSRHSAGVRVILTAAGVSRGGALRLPRLRRPATPAQAPAPAFTPP
jgi:hypothetical protein